MAGTSMFYREGGISVARQEWDQIRGCDSVAAAFLLARIKQVALAKDSQVEADSDRYNHNPPLYCYEYGGQYAAY
jgi:hypothetical protein